MQRVKKAKVRRIGVGAVVISTQAKKYINEVLKNNRLTYGPFTRKFESTFGRLHHRKFVLFCNSGTSALQVGFHALKKKYKWKDGAEVIIPATTFVASVNVVLQNNLQPTFADIEPEYFMLDPKEYEAKITKKTVAVEPVHVAGQSADMDPIMRISQKNNIRVIEDSCEAMLVPYHNKPVGSYGDIACFSTYAAHLIVTGVGGLATTSDRELAAIMKGLFNHGRDGIYVSIDDDDDLTAEKELFKMVEHRFKYTDIGYSYRATELEAALGVAELENWEDMIVKRQKNAAYLSAGLSDLEDYLQLPKIRPNTKHSFMFYPLVLKNGYISRRKLIYFLEKNGIETRYLLPLLGQPVYVKLFGNIEKKFPVSYFLARHGFYIGCHHHLNKPDLDYILEVFHTFFRKNS